MSKGQGQQQAQDRSRLGHVRSQNRTRLESIGRIAKDALTDNNMDNQEQVTRHAVVMLTNISKMLNVNVNDWLEDTHDTDDSYIVRRHKDTWCSVRMGRCMFMLCVASADNPSVNPSVLVMDMETGKIVFKNDDEITDMIRESSEIPDEVSDDDMMFDYARNEYI